MKKHTAVDYIIEWRNPKSLDRVGVIHKFYTIMAQNEVLFAELEVRLDASETQAEWCDRCNEGHPAPLD